MHKPESLENGLLCDLSAIERELRGEPAYERNGTVTVHVVSGQLKLRVASRDVELHSGQVLILPAGQRHDVSAAVDSAFVLTLGRSAADAQPPG